MMNEKDNQTEVNDLGATLKNYLTCAVLMVVLGAGMYLLSKKTLALICIIVGVIFLIVSLVMYFIKKRNDAAKAAGDEHKITKKDE